MGRPLHKKYFGNRNIGTTGTSDNKIGGEGLASVSTATQGSININNSYPNFPTLTVADPTLPGGVKAVTSVTWEIDTISISGTNNNYTNSQTGVAATLNGLTGQAVVEPTFTIDTNGSSAVSNLHVVTRGEYTSIDGDGISTWAIVGAGGNNAQATVKFRVKSIAVSEKGSGYVSLPSLSWTTLSGTSPSGQTPALTTDSGAVGSATNQENAIVVYAKTTTGGTAQIGDIIKQEASRRYKVKTADGTAFCKLVATTSLQYKQAYLVATDANGNTYYVTKLTAHKALLTRKVDDGSDGDWLFVNGDSAPWSLTSTANGRVIIENA